MSHANERTSIQKVSRKQVILKLTKFAARYLRNETLEMTDSDLQDSATVIGQDTQSIFIVTNNHNDIHRSVQIQDMLADVLGILKSIQNQNTKANEEFRG
jgi:hypothetical protein